MKMMHGACFLACSNMSRTREAPTPTNISTKSEPEIVKKGTLASPAMARARRVLPVPGRPHHEHTFRDLAAKFLELAGIFQEIDDFDNFLLRFLDPRHVGEGDIDLILAQEPCATLTKGHGPPAAGGALHLAHEVGPEANENQYRKGRYEQLQENRLLLGWFAA